MNDPTLTRRAVLGTTLAGLVIGMAPALAADDPDVAVVEDLFGRAPTLSERLRLDMPASFQNGYTVPFALDVECAMDEADHPRAVHVLAPGNPLLRVATFRFTPGSGKARVSTRIRLAQPQNVVAVAEMSDGSLLMAKRWVVVETDGCG